MIKIDTHLHIVGNGSSGSGCTLNLHGIRKIYAHYMVRSMGLEKEVLSGSLDEAYVERILTLIRESSLDKAVILAMGKAYDEDGEIINTVMPYVPNDYVLLLGKKFSEFLPAVSIHPAQTNALPELERCIGEGAAMLKILPNCQNINCNNIKYAKFWEAMAKAKLPLLAHTGGELTLPVINSKYANPEILTLALQSGVNVIAAHAGTNSSLFDANYLSAFTRMLSKYTNLYGDNSAFNTPIRSRYNTQCCGTLSLCDSLSLCDNEIAKRIIYGSDLPVPVNSLWVKLWNMHRKEVIKDINSIKPSLNNPLERDYQIKRAIGFSLESFTRVSDLLLNC